MVSRSFLKFSAWADARSPKMPPEILVGGSDHIFAGHPAEEKRAKELRKVCSEQRIPMDDVAKAIEHFLKSKKVGDALIQEQVERARKFLKLS